MADFDIYSPGDIFDSRDVMDRFEELDAELTDLHSAVDAAAEVVAQWQEALDKAKGIAADRERDYNNLKSDDDATDEALDGYAKDMEDAEYEVERLERELAENEESLKDAERALEEWTDYEEWDAIRKFKEEAEGYGDWDYGETFIADSYFEDYARELAEDTSGRAIRDAEWPMNCIDWEAAAEQLKADYTSYELPGIGGNTVTYWARS